MNTAQDDISTRYEAYVKKCVRLGQQPLMPGDWLKIEQMVAEFRQTDVTKIERVEPKLRVAPEPTLVDEDRVRKQFTQMMIDNGINNSMSVMQRTRHFVVLGYHERPATVKQTKPCELCGDILCAWAL
jgi:hypothetical protein